jgi:uncharacterized protein (TIGR00251 family)
VPDDLYEIAPRPGADEPPDLILRVHVQPGAGRTAIVGRHGDALKVKVGAPPAGGRANTAVLELVATSLGIASSQVSIQSGAASRTKRLRITGLAAEELARLLDLLLAGAGPAAGPGNAGAGGGVHRHTP